MTREEAKKCVKRIRSYMEGGECWTDAEFEAMDMAVAALGAIEQIQWERDTAVKQLFLRTSRNIGYQPNKSVMLPPPPKTGSAVQDAKKG